MPRRYEVLNSKLKTEGQLIFVSAFEVIRIEKVEVRYPQGIYPDKIVNCFDIMLDDNSEHRVMIDHVERVDESKNIESLKIGDLVYYDVAIDDFSLFIPENFPVQVKLVS